MLLARKPRAYKPFRGNSTITTFSKVRLSVEAKPSNNFFAAEYITLKKGIFKRIFSHFFKSFCPRTFVVSIPVRIMSINVTASPIKGKSYSWPATRTRYGFIKLSIVNIPNFNIANAMNRGTITNKPDMNRVFSVFLSSLLKFISFINHGVSTMSSKNDTSPIPETSGIFRPVPYFRQIFYIYNNDIAKSAI